MKETDMHNPEEVEALVKRIEQLESQVSRLEARLRASEHLGWLEGVKHTSKHLGCNWCEWEVARPESAEEMVEVLAMHVISECKHHPMRTLEYVQARAYLGLRGEAGFLELVAGGMGGPSPEDLEGCAKRLRAYAESLGGAVLDLSPVPVLLAQVESLGLLVQQVGGEGPDSRG